MVGSKHRLLATGFKRKRNAGINHLAQDAPPSRIHSVHTEINVNALSANMEEIIELLIISE